MDKTVNSNSNKSTQANIKNQIKDASRPIFDTSSVKTIKKDISDWLVDNLKDNKDKIEVLETTDKKFGDYSTNIAMALASKNKQNPREVAQVIMEKLNENLPYFIEKIEVAGPGFINFFLSENYLQTKIQEIIQKKDDFGKFDLGKGKTIMVEYGQPNTHKAFHMGHLKSAISGLAIIRLFENFSYDVVKVNFFSDIGMHVAKCMWGLKKLGIPDGIDVATPDEKIALLQKAYTYGANEFKENKESENEIRYINNAVYSKADKEVNELYDQTRRWSIEHQDDVFNILGVKYDRQYPESEIVSIGRKLVEANIPKVFQEDQGAFIFRAEKYGLHNRVFISSEGNVTYEGKDMGLGKIKNDEYKFEHSFVFTAADHIEYFKVVIKALEFVVPELQGRYHHIPFGFMLVKGKKESSRSGISLTGKDLIMQMINLSKNNLMSREEVDKNTFEFNSKLIGINSLRYMILKHPFHVDVSFDPDEALSLDGNSAPYLMYTYARAKSIIRKSKIKNSELAKSKLVIENDNDSNLASMICKYEEVLVTALDKMSPHVIASYVYELSTLYNKFYKENQVLGLQNEELERSRLLLTYATAQVIKNGLNLLHIEVLERM